MIEARGLIKNYGDKTAVDDLSFTIKSGIVTGFLGPNGALHPPGPLRPQSSARPGRDHRHRGALPEVWANRINKWLPSNAGQALMSFGSESTPLSPWRGFAVFCGYAVAAVLVAATILTRRDA